MKLAILVSTLTLFSSIAFAQVQSGSGPGNSVIGTQVKVGNIVYTNTPQMEKILTWSEDPRTAYLTKKQQIEKCESSEKFEKFKDEALAKNLNILEAFCTASDSFNSRTLAKKGDPGTRTVRTQDLLGFATVTFSSVNYVAYMHILFSDARNK